MDFDFIYTQYFKDVFLYLRSLSANEDVAEEIAQETFAKALKAVDQYDGSKDVRAWLFTIAKNTYYTACKRQRLFSGEEPSENMSAAQSVFVEHMIDEESAFQIHTFLHDMKEPYKEVFTLRVFGELSFEKIGRLFGKTSSWARVVFYRAKTQIKEYMEEVDHE
ncbi:MAG: sigma-70 family RNA polymerase sigma factor [Methanocorpusculum sp.]|nr:sigma-70 family RNA polymerase sigma factor [Oscillospiraceae bacterium]MBQ3570216.1 sigma-70 family RNA polymerase sigma factor [Methanocorpusculum sp.]